MNLKHLARPHGGENFPFPGLRPAFFRCILLLAVLPLFASIAGAQEVSSRLLSRSVARGERTILELAFTGVRPPPRHPAFPETPGISITPSGNDAFPRQIPGRKIETVFEYIVSSYQPGTNTIPAAEVIIAGKPQRTEPIEFTVFNPDDLVWKEANVGSRTILYAAAVQPTKKNPYNGEAVPVEVKLYLPDTLHIEDYGLPDLEREGVTAWRFAPSGGFSRINLNGRPYIGIAYPSTLTTTRTGPVSLGPGKVRLITVEATMDVGFRRVALESYLDLPKLELESKPLPEGAPEGFENAVGDFRIGTSTDIREVQEGDPIPVRITVSGTGNLDNIRPPKPIETDGWKIYDATTEQRGDERREHAGTMIFSQFLRPLNVKPAVPAYQLVFFDPASATYKTVVSEPIPVKITPSTAKPMGQAPPPKAGQIPVEQMNDILGLLPPGAVTTGNPVKIPRQAWHAIPAVIALALVIAAFRKHFLPRLQRKPETRERASELREIERLRRGDGRDFLLAAGRFVERWFGASPPQELAEILAERDARCFRRDAPTDMPDPSHRSGMLRSLKRAAASLPLILTLALAGISSIGNLSARETTAVADKTARDAYHAANYSEAVKSWLELAPYDKLSADVLYHIGDACYRAGSPGQAALYFRRAILRSPAHPEAAQNLRFIERKYGALVNARPAYQEIIGKIPQDAWLALLAGAGWLMLVSLLIFPATNRGAKARSYAIGGFAAAPLLAAAAWLALHHYPDDAKFAPLARQAVVVADGAVLHADASRTATTVIEAPPGSLCEVVRISGGWAYISFSEKTKTRGWIPTGAIEYLIPRGRPKPPEFHKQKADESSA